MTEPSVTCPECGTEIKLTETLAAPIIDAERGKIEAKFQERAKALQQREVAVGKERESIAGQKAELDRIKEEIDKTVAEQVAQARETIEKQAEQKAAKASATELEAIRKDLAEKDAKLAEAQKAELEIRQQRQALEDEKREFDLKLTRTLDEERQKIRDAVRTEETRKATEATAAELKAAKDALAEKEAKVVEAHKAELEIRQQRQALEDEKREFELKLTRAVDEERNKIREVTRKEDEEQYRLKVAEKDKVIADMQKQVEELRRKSEQGSQQLQGEIQELDLHSMLERAFPDDIIEDVPKGQHGGDVLQRVVGPNGRACGTILWESKRTKAWSDGWLPKLRDDQRAAGAELAAIMSAALPKHISTFGEMDTVWITSPTCVIPLATALRQTVSQVAAARQALEGRQDKMEVLYRYLTSPQFKQRVAGIVEACTELRLQHDKEKQAYRRIWARREKQFERISDSVAGMYGDLQGIAGASLPEIDGMDLPQLESAAPEDGDSDDEHNSKDEAA